MDFKDGLALGPGPGLASTVSALARAMEWLVRGAEGKHRMKIRVHYTSQLVMCMDWTGLDWIGFQNVSDWKCK